MKLMEINILNRKLATFLSAFIAILLTNISHTFAVGNTQATLSKQLESHQAWVKKQKNTDQASFIGTYPNKAIPLSGTHSAFSALQNALIATRIYGTLFAIQDPTKQLSLLKQKTLPNGQNMVRFQQVHHGIPILGAELIVNLDAQQRLLAMNGQTSSAEKDIDTAVATIDAEQAKDMALTAVAKWHHVDPAKLQTDTPQLKIYDPSLIGPGTDNSTGQLVWSITVSSTTLQPIKEMVLINAQLGFIALHFNQVHTVKNRHTYDSGGRSGNYFNLPGTRICSEQTSYDCYISDVPEAGAAHQYAGDTYDFFWNRHSRDSIDNQGASLISSVDFCFDSFNCPFRNAFWIGDQMVYGSGMVTDDIAGHEITHGFTERTSNLFYYYQSGAINESLSDMWGEFIDLTNSGGNEQLGDRWYIGEDASTNSTQYRGAIRSMSNPALFGDPDKMSSSNYWYKSRDNGGVHINSGINNKAVYLMTDGDTFNNITVKGIGIDKVSQIYYDAATTMLVSGSDYSTLYTALIQSCNNLVGTKNISHADCNEVKNALNAVEMDHEPSPGFQPRAKLCPGSKTAHDVFKDDFESGLGKWAITNVSDSVGWGDLSNNVVYGYYTSSGTHALYSLGHYNETSDQYAQTTVTVPPVNAYLHFHHAFEFENSGGDFFDGGVLEYSSDAQNWQDAGKLYDTGQDYKGNILSGSGNPLAGRKGFVGTSHGYVSSRYDLSALAGQKIHFRWRHGTDKDYAFLGWYIDDVSVYACNTAGNHPPSATKLLAPINNAVINNSTVTLEWQTSTDPDGDPITETVLLCQKANCTPAPVPATLLSLSHSNLFVASLGGSSFLLMGLFSAGTHHRKKLIVMTLIIFSALLSGCPFDKKNNAASPYRNLTLNNLQAGISYHWMVRSSDNKGGFTDSKIQTFTIN